MPQNATDWTPTPKQAAVLEAAQEAGLNRSISAICEAAAVDRKSFYRWLKADPDFKSAWEELWQGSIRRQMNGVVAAMIARALVGDVPAARLVADLAGVTLTRQRIEAEVKQQTELTDNRKEADIEQFAPVVAELVAETERRQFKMLLQEHDGMAEALRNWYGADNFEAYQQMMRELEAEPTE